MCFSATASFVTGSALLVAGGASILVAKKPEAKFFAAIPLIFAVQQLTEGVLWLSMTHEEYWKYNAGATVMFLIFAQVVWPVWVPASILCLEKDPKRKKILRTFTFIGAFVSVAVAACLFLYHVSSEIAGTHIRYHFDFPFELKWYHGIFYFIPTSISTLISSNKKVRIVGIVLLISFIVSQIFFNGYVISVWCYFAATISALVFWVIKTLPASDN